jgi:hypothetical protein
MGKGKNVRWKVGIGTRIGISGDLGTVFVLTAIPAGTSLTDSHSPRGGVNRGMRGMSSALDRHDGRVVWERTARGSAAKPRTRTTARGPRRRR